MYSKSYSDNPDEESEDSSNKQSEPDYAFEGYTIELNKKIGLTPPDTKSPSNKQAGR